MTKHQFIDFEGIDYLAVPPDERARVVAVAMARARIERSLAMYEVISWVSRRISRMAISAHRMIVSAPLNPLKS